MNRNMDSNTTDIEEETIVAFACFSDTPRTDPQLRKHSDSWETLVDGIIHPTSAAKGNILPCNTLWLVFFSSRYGNGCYDEFANFVPQRLMGTGGSVKQLISGNIKTRGNNDSDLLFSHEQSVLSQMLSTVFATCVDIKRVSYALPLETPAFSPVADIFTALEDISHEEKMRKVADSGNINNKHNKKVSGYGGNTTTCSIYTLLRDDHFVPVILRAGIPEDYDDFVPLLLDGTGLLTPLPKILYLEELLHDEDDPYKSVIVAEDPVTHNVIGLMCIDASYSSQQRAVGHYSLDRYGKLKPGLVSSDTHGYDDHLPVVSCSEDIVGDIDIVQNGEAVRLSHAHRGPQFHPKKHGKDMSVTEGEHQNHNSFNITLFYLNPAYDKYSAQIMSYAFNIFKFAEYSYIYLPHTTTEHQLLLSCRFMYCHVKKNPQKPPVSQSDDNTEGYGLWLSSRYWLDAVYAQSLVNDLHSDSDIESVIGLLTSQSELMGSTVDSIVSIISQVGGSNSINDDSINNKAEGTLMPTPTEILQSKSSGMYCVTLKWRKQPIGVIITRPVTAEEMYVIRSNFDVDAFVNMNVSGKDYRSTDIHHSAQGARPLHHKEDMPVHLVKYMYVKPIFCHRIRFLLREAMRHVNAEVLLYIVQPAVDMFTPLVDELIFTPPRRVIDENSDVNNKKNRGGMNIINNIDKASQQPPKENLHLDGHICLYHTSRKALSDEKTKIYARIVVIGASSTGLSFIYSLLSIPYLHFTNIVLISPDGLPLHPSHMTYQWVTDSVDWHDSEYLLLLTPKRFRVVEGKMTDFDKFDRNVFTDDGTCEPYDHLLLTVGRQYTIPKDLVAIHGDGVRQRNGVFCLSNSIQHVVNIVQYISERENVTVDNNNTTSVVIYGSSIDVFALVSTLIKLAVASHRIVIVSPEEGRGQATSATSPFLDISMDATVDRLLAYIGAKVLRGYTLHNIRYDEADTVSSVLVVPIASSSPCDGNNSNGDKDKTYKGVIEIPASMFIYANDKDIDSNVLCALNKRSIVFDGRVIVGDNYRTTDPNIYAAGPVATISLKYGPSRDFDEYSAAEVGRHVAHTILGFLGISEYYCEALHGDVSEDTPNNGCDNINAGELKNSIQYDVAYNNNNNNVMTDLSNNNNTMTSRRPKPLPKYTDVVSKTIQLPNNNMYVIAYAIDFPVMLSRDAQMGFDNNNTSESTVDGLTPILTHYVLLGDEDDEDYARVSIESDNRYISSVSYFGNSSNKVKQHNLRALVGLPESTLNFVYSFTQNSLYNLTNANNNNTNNTAHPRMSIDFIRSPVLYITQYDRFRKLFENIKDILQKNSGTTIVNASNKCNNNTTGDANITHPSVSHGASGAECLSEVGRVKEEIREYLTRNNCSSIPDSDRLNYQKRLTQENSETRRLVEMEVIRFLHDNKYYLPQIYYLPDMTMHFMQ